MFYSRVKKSPSPAPIEIKETPSWSDQMAELTPINSPHQPEPPFDMNESRGDGGRTELSEKSKSTAEVSVPSNTVNSSEDK